jgi:hypothetical protein
MFMRVNTKCAHQVRPPFSPATVSRAASMLDSDERVDYVEAKRVGRFPSAERDRVPPTSLTKSDASFGPSRGHRAHTKGARVSTRTVPPRPSLDQLKIQANELQRAHRDRDPSAAARIAAHHPEMKGQPPEEVLDKRFALADAQLVIAREFGFRHWAD